MKNKPCANFFIEPVNGIYSEYCRTKEEALKQFQKIWESDASYLELDAKLAKQIKIENIETEVYYTHKRCMFRTFGDPWCCECNEPCGTNGRTTFVLYFKNQPNEK